MARQTYTQELKKPAARPVREQGYSVKQAAEKSNGSGPRTGGPAGIARFYP